MFLVHSHAGTLRSFLSTYISSRGNVGNKESITYFDEFGQIPQLQNTVKAVEKAHTISAVRTTNGTLISFPSSNSSYLEISVGVRPFCSLVNPWQHLLITGLAADCRLIVRHACESALNHTVAFGAPPSANYITMTISKQVQGYTTNVGGVRPLACHVFVIDSLRGELYEIDCAGTISRTLGGVGGKGAVAGREFLEKNYSPNATIDDMKVLVRNMLHTANSAQSSGISGADIIFVSDHL